MVRRQVERVVAEAVELHPLSQWWRCHLTLGPQIARCQAASGRMKGSTYVAPASAPLSNELCWGSKRSHLATGSLLVRRWEEMRRREEEEWRH